MKKSSVLPIIHQHYQQLIFYGNATGAAPVAYALLLLKLNGFNHLIKGVSLNANQHLKLAV